MRNMKRVRFQGREYFLVGETEGPIATEEEYVNGRCSYAYLTASGEILRFNQKIGTRRDIEIIGDVVDAPEETAEAFEVVCGLGTFTDRMS